MPDDAANDDEQSEMNDKKTAMTDLDMPARLDASSKPLLAASIRALAPGRRGWISMAEAAHLFSAKDAAYAFGEMDDDGNRNLASFAAATPRHRFDFMPGEGRLYFVSD
jgi:hypothetical protein